MMSETPNVYVVRADYGRYAQSFKTGGYVGIGFLSDVDLSDVLSNGKDYLYSLYDAADPEAGSGRRIVNVGQVWRFLDELQPGNIVMTPSANRDELMVGEITGDYYFSPITTDSRFAHRRPVRWFPDVLYRSSFSIPVQNTLGSTLTVFRVAQVSEVLSKLGRKISAPVQQVVEKDIDFSRRVIERILELSAGDFELLMTDLLRIIGFEASNVGQVGDRGIDVEGILQMYGFATVDLKVQVKRYASNTIDHKEITKFRGQVPEKSQAAFVTLSDFTKKAREEATRAGFKPIGLINGQQVVDLLIEHYESLLPQLQELLRLRRVLIPEI